MKHINEEYIFKMWRGEINKEQLLELLEVDSNNIDNEVYEFLEYSTKQKSGDDIEIALHLAFVYGLVSDNYLDIINYLILCDWHSRHEDMASILQKLKSPKSVDTLYDTIYLKPEYLDFDDNFALAVKCIWALYSIGNEEAKNKLFMLAASDNKIIERNAKERLEVLNKK